MLFAASVLCVLLCVHLACPGFAFRCSPAVCFTVAQKMPGNVHIGQVLLYTAELLARFDGNYLEMVMASPLANYFARVGAILLRRVGSLDDSSDISVARNYKGLPDCLRKLSYNKNDVSQKETKDLGNGWLDTQNYPSELPARIRSVGQYHDHFNAEWKATPKGERNALKNMDLGNPKAIQKLQEGGPVYYCESKSVEIGPTGFSYNAADPFRPEYSEIDDLHAAAPVHEEVFRNMVKCEGISTLYLYVWGKKSYSILHVEDALLGSLFKNKGKHPKYWMVIPLDEFPKLAALGATVVEKGVSVCGHPFLHKRYSPTVQEILAHGLAQHMFAQDHDDLMLVCCGVGHAVVNSGPGFGFTKNIVTPRWVKLSRYAIEMRDHCFLSPSEYNKNYIASFDKMTPKLKNLQARLMTSSQTMVDLLDSKVSNWEYISEDFKKLHKCRSKGDLINATGGDWFCNIGMHAVYCDREGVFLGEPPTDSVSLPPLFEDGKPFACNFCECECDFILQEFPNLPLLLSADEMQVATGFWSYLYDNLNDDLRTFFDSAIALTPAQCHEVFRSTIPQSRTGLWFDRRRNILTASKMHSVVVRKADVTEGFLGSLVKPSRPTKQMRYGIDHEEDAVQCYMFHQLDCGKMGLQITGAGLTICPGVPFVGATPDRLIYDPECEDGFGLLEVKVITESDDKDPKPFKWNQLPCTDDCSIESVINMYYAKKKELRKSFTFYLEKSGETWTLKKTHAYYCQVLTQLAVTGLAFCDFCVLFTNRVFVERIRVDLQSEWYTARVLGKIAEFYFGKFLPYVHAKQLKRS